MKPKLTVDTKGHCLLCYQLLNSQPNNNCQAALQALFNYLKVDHKKIVNFSPQFLSQLNLAKDDFDVDALICLRCSAVITWFHTSYQAYEHHRLEMEQSLLSLHQIMEIGANVLNIVREYTNRLRPKKLEQLGNVVGANILRRQTFNNCQSILNQFQPRVMLSRMETDFSNFPPLLRRQTVPTRVTNLQKLALPPPPPPPVNSRKVKRAKKSHPRPWRCQFCPTRMREAGNLKVHTMRIHTVDIVSAILSASAPCSENEVTDGITQVVNKVKKRGHGKNTCLFCDFKGKQRCLVKLHMLDKHLKMFANDVKAEMKLTYVKPSQQKGGEFKCSICSRKFTSQRHFKNHLRICTKLHTSGTMYRSESEMGNDDDLDHTSYSGYGTSDAMSTQERQLPPEVVDEFMEAVEQYNLELHDVLSTITAV